MMPGDGRNVGDLPSITVEIARHISSLTPPRILGTHHLGPFLAK